MTDTAFKAANLPLTWRRYLDHVLPEQLAGAGIDAVQAFAIAEDVAARAAAYAAGGRVSRHALRVPFLDDVAEFLPEEAPVGCRADVAVVVRNSLLEDAHAAGDLDDQALLHITYLASGAFNVWLNAEANKAEDDPPTEMFAEVAAYPCAYAALRALALAAETGGRRAFSPPTSLTTSTLPVPIRAAAIKSGQALGTEGDADGPHREPLRIHRSALSAPDDRLVQLLSLVSDERVGSLATSSMSRYSRNSVALAEIIEHILAHGATLLTTNFLLRPKEAFARRAPLIGADSYEHLNGVTTDRLAGIHAKYLRNAQARLSS